MRRGEGRARGLAKSLRKEMTQAEVILWSLLRKRGMSGFKFRRQHPVGAYVADFACLEAKLVIEVDGATHWTEEEQEHDARRTAFLSRRGWRVLRVTNLDVFEDLDGVWLAIERLLSPPAASRPPPPRAGEETLGVK